MHKRTTARQNDKRNSGDEYHRNMVVNSEHCKKHKYYISES